MNETKTKSPPWGGNTWELSPGSRVPCTRQMRHVANHVAPVSLKVGLDYCRMQAFPFVFRQDSFTSRTGARKKLGRGRE